MRSSQSQHERARTNISLEQLKRKANEDNIDSIVESWTGKRSSREVMEKLQAAGIAAGVLNSAFSIMQDAQFKARDFFQRSTRKVTGTQDSYPGLPVKFSKIKLAPKRPAPLLGEHNECVLKGILGLSREEISVLEKEEIIGSRPLGM